MQVSVSGGGGPGPLDPWAPAVRSNMHKHRSNMYSGVGMGSLLSSAVPEWPANNRYKIGTRGGGGGQWGDAATPLLLVQQAQGGKGCVAKPGQRVKKENKAESEKNAPQEHLTLCAALT